MYSFKDDYSEGAHPKILQALIDSNEMQEDGYGNDSHTKNAINKIKVLINNENVDIHLISGGTQTNLTAISSFLRPHEACIAANTAHISTHETGAIECTGHKIITIDTDTGKICPKQIQKVLDWHENEHAVKPKLVYISNSTEVGSIYSKKELEELSLFCKNNNLIFYLDGARLAAALSCDYCDYSIADICNLTDAFYIGGTKNGALLGEALVIKNDNLKSDFRFFIKQKGALLAKGRLLGIQFETLFTNNLYFELASHTNNMANLLREGLKSLNYNFLIDSHTNQIFPIISNQIIEKLKTNYSFHIWEQIDDEYSAIRLVTSWMTKETTINKFLSELNL